jgi:penicillin-binding protein 2
VIESPLQRRAPLPPQLTRRVGVLGALAFLLFAIIGFRLWYLQVLTGTQNVAAETQNVVRNVPIAAPRGDIVDRSGRLLATTRVAAEVAIVKDDLPPAGPARQALYQRLGRVLGLKPAYIQARVDDKVTAPLGYAPTAIEVDVSTQSLDYLAERKRDFPGVVEQQVYLRDYPHAKVGAVVLGEIGEITGPTLSSHGELGTAKFKGIQPGAVVGQAGLESAYQPYLQGKAGVEQIQVNAAGLPTGAPKQTAPTAGEELKTSLDLGLEEEGYQAVRRGIAAANANGKHATAGAFVAIDPFKGQVLALGSWPSYDPNAFAKPLSHSQYAAILHSNGLIDRAIDSVYPTGSTFKPITAWGALRTGLITAQTSQGAGSCLPPIGGVRFCNSGRNDYGNQSLVGALTVSEDTYFYLVGQSANGSSGDGHAIQNAARALGLGRSPGIDLPGGGARGTVPDKRWVAAANTQILAKQCNGHPTAAYRVACSQRFYYPDWTVGQNIGLATGQGYLQASPLQMAIAYSAIVNGGTVWTPQIGTQIDSQSGAVVQQLPPPTPHRVYINPAYRTLIMEGLHGAAQSPSGTSYAVFRDFPRTVYGKTGTAVRNGQADQSWYVAYVPDPTRPIVVAVTIEQGGFGAAAAAPAARLMLSQWFGLPKKFIVGTSPDR